MTKEELLALGLTEEQTAKVVEDYGKNYVSKDQFNAKNEELKSVKGELTTLNGVKLNTRVKSHNLKSTIL